MKQKAKPQLMTAIFCTVPSLRKSSESDIPAQLDVSARYAGRGPGLSLTPSAFPSHYFCYSNFSTSEQHQLCTRITRAPAAPDDIKADYERE